MYTVNCLSKAVVQATYNALDSTMAITEAADRKSAAFLFGANQRAKPAKPGKG